MGRRGRREGRLARRRRHRARAAHHDGGGTARSADPRRRAANDRLRRQRSRLRCPGRHELGQSASPAASGLLAADRDLVHRRKQRRRGGEPGAWHRSLRTVDIRPNRDRPACDRRARHRCRRRASAPQGWPGPAIVDGPFRWLLPPAATWIIGGDGDKLVLDSQIGWAIGEMRVLAIPLVRAASVGWLQATVVRGDIPPLFGGGTMGFGVTLPTRGCWAFVFLDPDATSTVVADLRQ